MKYLLKGVLALCLGVSGLVHAQVDNVQVIEISTSGQQSQAQRQPDVTAGSMAGQSELLLVVYQLQEEIRQLRGELEAQQHKLNRLETDQRDRYRDVDRRLSALINALPDPAAPPAVPAPEPIQSSAGAPSVSPPSAPVAPAPEVASVPDATRADQQAYDQAFNLVRERKFNEAIAAFEAFVIQFPNSSNTANGYYWLGEIHLAQQSLDMARVQFERVLSDFPSHGKVPDTLYKLGVVYSNLGQQERSRNMMQRVIDEFPQSTAASLARNFRAANS
ncbi:tol-pal system protein YbgF [Nitrincola alkalilacustris]|uniref:tol-pal system protein YbgF n=1 Tax=Nitrincola alkalilacustris TaxID=1571224 RepID=UPI00124E6811|nr:tol-pal system protein YbgF [Nitrincola alkalilacustris]